MSSVSVSCDQPPASMMVERRQMPAVPLKLKKRPERWRAVCSMTKWPSSIIACSSVRRE